MSKVENVVESFNDFIKDGVAVVDFWATWCGPCKMLAPILEGVAEKMSNVKFGKVDVDLAPELAKEYKIMAIPNVCVFKNGELVDRIIGLSEEDEIIEVISKHIDK